MGIDNVADEIIREAEKKAKAIAEEGDNIKNQTLDESRKKIKAEKGRIDRDMAETFEAIRIREMMKAKMSVKESILTQKKNLIDSCFDAAAEKIKGDVLQKLFETGKKSIEPEVVYVNSGDAEKAKKLFRGVSVKEKDIKGGIILESKDGKETIDMSLERLTEMARTKALKDVSKILFGD
ncbi:MAG: hypothetical protein HYT72_05470 [Candidatus Aenigmarchaeota archaeon]|nr:hypothetical protein [Candidatus Aenigmarchaeota archaeon]